MRFVHVHLKRVFWLSSWRVRHLWVWESNTEPNLSRVSSVFRCLPLKLSAFHPSSAVGWWIWTCTNIADGKRGVCHVRAWCRISSFVAGRISELLTVMFVKRRKTDERRFSNFLLYLEIVDWTGVRINRDEDISRRQTALHRCCFFLGTLYK
jgi:hypothetical protein